MRGDRVWKRRSDRFAISVTQDTLRNLGKSWPRGLRSQQRVRESDILAAGHKVVAPDMPSHGRDWSTAKSVKMPQYVATITDILDQQDEPVVLVAHSRGGLQITQAAEERPNKIRKLVYLASVLLPN
jgi:pimeloyl-ACP methyl ester carboxylesterase